MGQASLSNISLAFQHTDKCSFKPYALDMQREYSYNYIASRLKTLLDKEYRHARATIPRTKICLFSHARRQRDVLHECACFKRRDGASKAGSWWCAGGLESANKTRSIALG